VSSFGVTDLGIGTAGMSSSGYPRSGISRVSRPRSVPRQVISDVRVNTSQRVRQRQGWFNMAGGPAAGKQYLHVSSLNGPRLSSAL
jgi:hypothetical protein